MTNEVIVPTSPEDLKVIKDELDAASECLTRIALEREKIKDIISGVSETFELDKKYVRKMINVHYKSNLQDVNDEHESLMEIYQAVTGYNVE